jgi:glycosyltransferase involved in cell wall biosynthesis
MKIGLFTDTYHANYNGVVLVVDVTRRELEKLGHEVYVFAPSANLRNQVLEVDADDDHLIHFPAVTAPGTDDFKLPILFPPHVLREIKDLKLDIIHFFTPGPMMMMAAYAAKKTHLPLIAQHTTDTYNFSDSYKTMQLGYAAMSVILPATTKTSHEQRLRTAKLFVPRKPDESEANWGRRVIGNYLSIVYAACDAVIAVSEKSRAQLEQILAEHDETANFVVIPTGVDPYQPTTPARAKAFRTKYGLTESDEVVVNFGRMAAEKNLAMLIPMLEELVELRPHAKLLLAGDFDYRAELEKIAADSPIHDRIIFSGYYTHDEVSTICAVSKIYAFPPLYDTQGMVVQEAAHCGLPIVLCDPLAPAVFRAGENGLVAVNDPRDFAAKCAEILADDQMRKRFGAKSRELAADLTEKKQTEKIVELYRAVLRK